MGPPASYRVSRVRYYSGATCRYRDFAYGDFTLCVLLFQNSSAILPTDVKWSTTPKNKSFGLASFPFARRYLGNRCFFLFLGLLRCFSSPRFLLMHYVFMHGYLHITTGGFPHSEICGSTDMCSLPQLIAACHVLLRLPVPRHPPYALSHLTFCSLFFPTTSLLQVHLSVAYSSTRPPHSLLRLVLRKKFLRSSFEITISSRCENFWFLGES